MGKRCQPKLLIIFLYFLFFSELTALVETALKTAYDFRYSFFVGLKNLNGLTV